MSDESRSPGWRSGPRPTRASTLGAFTLLLLAGWTMLGAYLVHSALPFNPIELPLEKRLLVPLWAPQGWKFFTRNPREEDSVAFLRGDGAQPWYPAIDGVHAEPHHLFGLDRRARAQGIELGLVLSLAETETWTGCRRDPVLCLEDLEASASVVNPTPRPALCGSVGVVRQEPVPWAWSDRRRPKIIMPSRVLRLEVSC